MNNNNDEPQKCGSLDKIQPVTSAERVFGHSTGANQIRGHRTTSAGAKRHHTVADAKARGGIENASDESRRWHRGCTSDAWTKEGGKAVYGFSGCPGFSLSRSVMVTHQTLVLAFKVRVLAGQQIKSNRHKRWKRKPANLADGSCR